MTDDVDRHHAQAGRDGDRGRGRQLAQAGRRHRRVRRPAVRGVHGQGRLGDPQPVRRRDPGDPRAGGGDGAGRHPAGADRRARVHPGGAGSVGGHGRGRGGRSCARPIRRRRRWVAPRRCRPRRPPGDSAPAGEVHDITMPKLGETVTEGTVGNWLKQVGDTVAFDDPLFEVSTDKVDSEIPSPYDGVLLEILVRGGGDGAGRHPGRPHRRARGRAGGRLRERPAPAASASAAPAAASAAAGAAGRCVGQRRRRAALAARAPAGRREQPGPGDGPGHAVWAGGSAARTSRRPIASGGAAAAAPAPAAGRRAGGPATAAPRGGPGRAAAAPKAGGDPRDQVQPLSRMRLALAERAQGARRSLAASVWTSVEVDYDNVDKVRAKHKDRFKKETGCLAVVPAVRLAGGGRRAARVPDGQLLDRRRGQDHDAAPVRQPRDRGRPQPAGPRRAGGEGRRPAEHAGDRPGDHQDRGRGPRGARPRWTT